MSNSKENWEDVLSKIEGIGLKLKMHLEAEFADDPDEPKEADVVEDAAGTAEKGSETDALMAGVEKFVDMIDDAFDAIGSAAKNDAVRSDFRDLGEQLRNALAATWNDAGADLREILMRPKRPADDSAVGEIIAGDPNSDATDS